MSDENESNSNEPDLDITAPDIQYVTEDNNSASIDVGSLINDADD